MNSLNKVAPEHICVDINQPTKKNHVASCLLTLGKERIDNKVDAIIYCSSGIILDLLLFKTIENPVVQKIVLSHAVFLLTSTLIFTVFNNENAKKGLLISAPILPVCFTLYDMTQSMKIYKNMKVVNPVNIDSFHERKIIVANISAGKNDQQPTAVLNPVSNDTNYTISTGSYNS